MPEPVRLGPGAALLRGFAAPDAQALMDVLGNVLDQAPLRHMTTSRGLRMSVAMSNCGELGWISDRCGYRYDSTDPQSGRPWPTMPMALRALATRAAACAGYDKFSADACLVNRYEPGSRLSLHQDRDERDFSQPIVSVSLGLPAVFLFGGPARSDKTVRIPLVHGDVVVWGGAARLHHHGVLPLKDAEQPMTWRCRINLTFRRAG